VAHANETFSLAWDPGSHSAYTAPYVQQFLRDVADGSGTFTSPYAVTTQYTDAGGRVGNNSVYGGGYDFTAAYPGSGCPVSGTHVYASGGGGYHTVPNDTCLTDAQLQAEIQQMVRQNGLISRIQPGHTPVLVLQTPPGVETCLDTLGHLCSANSDMNASDTPHTDAQFCSYHSQINVSGTVFAYVVLPFVADQTDPAGHSCDEPDAPPFPNPIQPSDLVTDMGARLVSPLSQTQLAAITNPALNGWFALDGHEINDNDGCAPLNQNLDQVTVGSNSYLLQREFNNGGAIIDNPFSLPCTPNVVLQPSFVVPSAVDAGDIVELDGSKSSATLLVPRANYSWNFGDGTSATGPSVVHSYGTGGIYTVTLTVTDRGGNVASVSQQIQVLGANGQPVPVVVSPPPTTSPAPPQNGGLTLRLQLMPQSLRNVLAFGIKVRVSSNMAADGIATVSIPRKAAKRAHIKVGNSPLVRIGIGTVQVKNGTGTLHVHLSQAIAAKLRRLGHVTLTVRLRLVAAGGHRASIVEAGRY
jgi:hypothetical protein